MNEPQEVHMPQETSTSQQKISGWLSELPEDITIIKGKAFGPTEMKPDSNDVVKATLAQEAQKAAIPFTISFPNYSLSETSEEKLLQDAHNALGAPSDIDARIRDLSERYQFRTRNSSYITGKANPLVYNNMGAEDDHNTYKLLRAHRNGELSPEDIVLAQAEVYLGRFILRLEDLSDQKDQIRAQRLGNMLSENWGRAQLYYHLYKKMTENQTIHESVKNAIIESEDKIQGGTK